MFLVKKKEVSLVQLESLLDALVKETDTLTESQIEDVTYIQDIIKQDSKIILSEDASVKYQEFIEKVVLFDYSLQKSFLSGLKSIWTGMDETKYKEIEEKALNKAHDEESKKEMIKEIDDMLANAKVDTSKEYGPKGSMVSKHLREKNKDKISEFITKLNKLKSKIQSTKTK